MISAFRRVVLLAFLGAMSWQMAVELEPWGQNFLYGFRSLRLAPTTAGLMVSVPLMSSAAAPPPPRSHEAPPVAEGSSKVSVLGIMDVELGPGSGWDTVARMLALVLGMVLGSRMINLGFARLERKFG